MACESDDPLGIWDVSRSALDVEWLTPMLAIGSAPSPENVEASSAGALVLCSHEHQLARADFTFPLIVLRAPFDDTEQPAPEDIVVAVAAASWTVDRLRSGVSTLVTCWAGRNRSGLVCALALRGAYGLSGPDAVALVKSKRLGALTNRAFEKLALSE